MCFIGCWHTRKYNVHNLQADRCTLRACVCLRKSADGRRAVPVLNLSKEERRLFKKKKQESAKKKDAHACGVGFPATYAKSGEAV